MAASMSDDPHQLPPAIQRRLDEAIALLIQQAHGVLSWPGGFHGRFGVEVPVQAGVFEPPRGTFDGVSRPPRR